LLKYKIP